MPFALIMIGVVLVVASVQNTQGTLFTLVKGDFTGPNNFFYWVAILLVIGTAGYIKPLQPVSRAFLVLLMVVLFLSKGNPQNAGGGVFAQLTSALNIQTSPTSLDSQGKILGNPGFPTASGFPAAPTIVPIQQ